MDIVADCEMYQTDYPKIQAVGEILKAKQGTWTLPEEFATEIGERFLDAGYVVEVMLGVSDSGGINLYSYHVRITGRAVAKIDPFDHERQAYEVRKAAGVPLEGINENEAWRNVSYGRPDRK